MPTPTDETSPPPPALSKAEIAFFIRAIWDALRSPGWGPSTRKDLQKLGEALYSGKSLKELDDDLYDRLLPHLVVVATSLGHSIQKAASETPPNASTAPDKEQNHG